MVIGSPPTEEGKRIIMTDRSSQSRDVKKPAKQSLKEKRAAKREKTAPTAFIKPRKGASG
jgi:hypothetical protein